ncbi:hypothetical protein R3W88_019034 [Solanum pinnatisectum]|uniref:Uncharacterized protein n=1 Tax=Solanum pinnatisectum TaxID=50273 RepID=A0AAV9KM35_9SOLN|nr:hypothetical protein R3W88_019034 [Solanum pinnatisectum]
MCFLKCVCNEEEKEVGRKIALGVCPRCEGKVEAIDVEGSLKFCFLPICYRMKRKYLCIVCSRHLVLLYS